MSKTDAIELIVSLLLVIVLCWLFIERYPIMETLLKGITGG